jgi:hypothetical protein
LLLLSNILIFGLVGEVKKSELLWLTQVLLLALLVCLQGRGNPFGAVGQRLASNRGVRKIAKYALEKVSLLLKFFLTALKINKIN